VESSSNTWTVLDIGRVVGETGKGLRGQLAGRVGRVCDCGARLLILGRVVKISIFISIVSWVLGEAERSEGDS
tara:strand:+ start:166 stop:384 length:219 start_codon:yes stop_codon:yes gene_type:complete